MRSYSTTVSPKVPEARVTNTNVNVSAIAESPAVSRKKSVASNATVTNTNTVGKAENRYKIYIFPIIYLVFKIEIIIILDLRYLLKYIVKI